MWVLSKRSLIYKKNVIQRGLGVLGALGGESGGWAENALPVRDRTGTMRQITCAVFPS